MALHRAVYLARTNPDARVLLTTFSDILANALRGKLKRLISNEPHLAERLEVHSIADIGHRLYKALVGPIKIANRDGVAAIIKQAAAGVPGHKFTQAFLLAEWEQVVDAWNLTNWEEYRDVKRLGRKTRLTEASREKLWSIFSTVIAQLTAQKQITEAGMFTKLAGVLAKGTRSPFAFAVVDEAQDIGIAHLRFLAGLGASRPNALFFAGDLGQRIFQQPFSWKALGVDVRGRSKTLTVNYRTSHQIRQQVDKLLGPEVSDADGNTEERGSTVSVFNGPPPKILAFKTVAEESTAVSQWISERSREGVMPHEIGVFVRSEAEIDRALSAVKVAGIAFIVLDDRVETVGNKVCISTMHLASPNISSLPPHFAPGVALEFDGPMRAA